MERIKVSALVVLCTMIACGVLWAARAPLDGEEQGPLVHDTRELGTDLEVSGLPGMDGSPGRGFISYKDLLALPQVSGMMGDDDSVTGVRAQSVAVTGVRVDVLMERLGIAAGKDIVLARCSDGYVGPLPPDYIAT